MIEQALASGTRDTLTLLHATEIRLATKQQAGARTRGGRVLACPSAIAPVDDAQARRARSLLSLEVGARPQGAGRREPYGGTPN